MNIAKLKQILIKVYGVDDANLKLTMLSAGSTSYNDLLLDVLDYLLTKIV
jgi:hypothetical protein